jgi:hypothetical protein
VIIRHLEATGEKLDLLSRAPAAVVLEMAEELAAELDQPVTDFLPRDNLYRQAAVRLDDGVNTFIRTLSAMWKEVSAAGRGKGWGAKEIAAAWEAKHKKQGRADEKALLEAEEALSLMLDSFASLRPGVAKDRLRAKVEAQEEAIAELRTRAVPLSHKLEDAAGLVERCREELATVRRLLLSEDKESVARRSAAVLGRAVRRLTVFFRDEDRGKGQERAVPVSVQVTPMTGDAVEYRADVLTPTQGRWRSRTSRVTT